MPGTPSPSSPFPIHLGAAALDFVQERHLATLTTLRADGTPHVVAIGFTWDAEDGIARVITGGSTQKARNVERNGYASLCQVEGARWLTLEGPARVRSDADSVEGAVARYTRRYRTPRENPTRVALEITVRRVLASPSLRS
ncbi:PPOX class F420-dependent oxidoreductase [Rhodococcus sp. HNM0569]|uniref:PPOX class F420-dependent oxidoreductase n=1 Tax=Rhodococcus sp. HNM0569 TaxID=2716340 RepID=UPI00146EB481|nr:PPOX class F420-dependent oxidoreductase [Rhodococcus sp. HNM0569]NLU84877.1 PPOX class F420-dependent oxidoreductase [Rhodococcus sp. HNM0569]